MTRVKRGPTARRRRKKTLKMASGYFGSRSRLFRNSKESVQRALCYSYRDRKVRKRFFRRLWILRINASCRNHNIKYSEFIHLLQKNNIEMDRKLLAHIAYHEPTTFKSIVDQVRK